MKRRTALRLAPVVLGGVTAGCLKNTLGPEAAETRSTPCPMPSFDASNSGHYMGVQEFERRIFDKMNESRAGFGVDPVERDAVLAYVARLHSRDMAKGDYISHRSESGMSLADRVGQFGYDCRGGSSENIHVRDLYYSNNFESVEEAATGTIEGWETSDGHRKIMWSDSVEVAGVGCFISAEHDLYVTCDFCSHDPADAADAATGTPPEDGCYYGGDPP